MPSAFHCWVPPCLGSWQAYPTVGLHWVEGEPVLTHPPTCLWHSELYRFLLLWPAYCVSSAPCVSVIRGVKPGILGQHTVSVSLSVSLFFPPSSHSPVGSFGQFLPSGYPETLLLTLLLPPLPSFICSHLQRKHFYSGKLPAYLKSGFEVWSFYAFETPSGRRFIHGPLSVHSCQGN